MNKKILTISGMHSLSDTQAVGVEVETSTVGEIGATALGQMMYCGDTRLYGAIGNGTHGSVIGAQHSVCDGI